MVEKLSHDQCAALKTADWTFDIRAEKLYSERFGKIRHVWLYATNDDDDDQLIIDGDFDGSVFTTLKGTVLPPVLAKALADSASSRDVVEIASTGANIVAELRETMGDEIEE